MDTNMANTSTEDLKQFAKGLENEKIRGKLDEFYIKYLEEVKKEISKREGAE